LHYLLRSWNMGLSNNSIEAICVAWRKGISRIWRLPTLLIQYSFSTHSLLIHYSFTTHSVLIQYSFTTHSVLIPALWETLPLVDMFLKRMLNFVYRCLNSHSSLLKFVVMCGKLFGQMDSVVGRNVRNCSLRYSPNVNRIGTLDFGPHNIYRYAVTPQVDLNTSALLLELLQCRDGLLTLSNDNFNTKNIAVMIYILCTVTFCRWAFTCFSTCHKHNNVIKPKL